MCLNHMISRVILAIRKTLKLPRMTAEDPPLRRVGPGFFPRLHFELEFKENQILFLLLLLNFSKYSGSI